MNKRIASLLLATAFCSQPIFAEQIWTIGNNDNSAKGFALAPDKYKDYLAHDFGYEDRYFLIGHSDAEKDFPYIIPGPSDGWGGTGGTSGWRTHETTILFGIEKMPSLSEQWKLVIDVLDNAVELPPLLKVTVNGEMWKFQLPKGKNKNSITGDLSGTTENRIEIPVNPECLHEGGNEIRLSVLQGSWIMFDQVMLEGPSGVSLVKPGKAFVRNVKAAEYELKDNGNSVQPLLVDVEELSGRPNLEVELDGKKVFSQRLDTARYILEAPMPTVKADKKSNYVVKADGKVIAKGSVTRSQKPEQTLADYVDTRIGTGHSRWMIAPGPWMPFSMVKLSPDNQNSGWQSGYQPTFENIGCFSHIHEWTLGGLGLMPTNGKLVIQEGDEADPDSGYRSRIDKRTEKAGIGYYAINLEDYDIKAELTATTRCGFQRYTFPTDREGARILVDLHIPTEYDYMLREVELRRVNDYRIEGVSHQLSKNVWSDDADQDYKLHFVLEFDQPIADMGIWADGEVRRDTILKAKDLKDAGAYLQFDVKNNPVVQVRSGISLVSIENASLNLETEITRPFGWNFEAVKKNQLDVWNDIFGRVQINTADSQEKTRFYNNMYRALCSRNTWSDVNGEWISTDKKVRRLANSDDMALGCDAFWNTFWNLNQFWNLVTPEWSKRWVNSQLAMYDANGWLAKGPAGMNYIPVMVAEHEIPLIVGAYQMGIRDFDTDKALEAMLKMQSTPSQKVFDGYAGNRDLKTYLEHGYVPSDQGRFSNSLEYSYDDWTVGQFAKALGKDDIYKKFNERGYWWKNVIDRKSGFAVLKDSKGKWAKDFDPFRSGANQHYVEGNAWQLTYFVPQDVPALADYMGKKRFIERLEWGFQASEPWRYNAPNDQYWDFPVVQGNQQSMHFAFLFNWVGKPWETQKWSRSIIDRYYGAGIANAYLGDEDQGQMSAWFIMAAIGLFQTDGGCNINPVYEIASPLYEKTIIRLDNRYGRGDKFVIEARNASRLNKYIQSATLNGKPLNSFKFPASELLKGGTLVLEMGDKPNKKWGVEK